MSQHDYNIANGGGAAVRADINAALAAILSVNSGPTAPATTAPYMLWNDTASGLLKIRNAADTAWLVAITPASDNTFTGVNQFNTPAAGDNSNKAATTAFVQAKDLRIATRAAFSAQTMSTAQTNLGGAGNQGTAVFSRGTLSVASGQMAAPSDGFVRVRGVITASNNAGASSANVQLRVNGSLVSGVVHPVAVSGQTVFELGGTIASGQAAAVSGSTNAGTLDFTLNSLTYEFFPA